MANRCTNGRPNTVGAIPSDRCPVMSVLPVCNVGVLYCGQTIGLIKINLACRWASDLATLCKMETQIPHGQRHSRPPLSKFTGAGFACVRIIRGPCPLWPNGWMDQDAIWCGGWPQPRLHCVRWEPKGTQPPNFRDGSKATGRYSLGPGDIVLVVDPVALPPKGHSPLPIFGPCLLWPNHGMD